MKAELRKSGFTLVELLAVAAVIALLTAGSVHLLMRNQRNWTVQRFGQELALAARTARIYAIQTGQPWLLVLDAEERRFYICPERLDETTLEMSLNPEQKTVSLTPSRPVRLPDDIQFEKAGILNSTEESFTGVLFKRDGSAQTAVIQVGDGTHHATVSILEATGRVRVTPGELETLVLDRVDLDALETISTE